MPCRRAFLDVRSRPRSLPCSATRSPKNPCSNKRSRRRRRRSGRSCCAAEPSSWKRQGKSRRQPTSLGTQCISERAGTRCVVDASLSRTVASGRRGCLLCRRSGPHLRTFLVRILIRVGLAIVALPMVTRPSGKGQAASCATQCKFERTEIRTTPLPRSPSRIAPLCKSLVCSGTRHLVATSPTLSLTCSSAKGPQANPHRARPRPAISGQCGTRRWRMACAKGWPKSATSRNAIVCNSASLRPCELWIERSWARLCASGCSAMNRTGT